MGRTFGAIPLENWRRRRVVGRNWLTAALRWPSSERSSDRERSLPSTAPSSRLMLHHTEERVSQCARWRRVWACCCCAHVVGAGVEQHAADDVGGGDALRPLHDLHAAHALGDHVRVLALGVEGRVVCAGRGISHRGERAGGGRSSAPAARTAVHDVVDVVLCEELVHPLLGRGVRRVAGAGRGAFVSAALRAPGGALRAGGRPHSLAHRMISSTHFREPSMETRSS